MENLVRVALQLQPIEIDVLQRVAERLLAGQETYGRLWKGKKSWTKEAAEEAFDMSVYLSCLLNEMKESE